MKKYFLMRIKFRNDKNLMIYALILESSNIFTVISVVQVNLGNW